MASIELKEVEKRFGDFVGVARQSLVIADGEFMVLLGPSGCGKTTTMRMIAGLINPTSGEIWIGDQDVTAKPPRARDVAMVFQNYGLYPHMTIANNIGYPLKIRGYSKRDRRALVEKVAATVELDALLDRRPVALSGGQRQRVALARAIVREPRAFLMDEPLSNLDAQLRISMRAQIKHLQHNLGVTAVYVTHDQIEAMTLADRIAVINEGVIQQLDEPENIYDRPANLFVAGFIGSPPMNLLSGDIEEGIFTCSDCTIKGIADAGKSRQDIALGVRPEDADLVEPERGMMTGAVYSSELTGDAVFATVDVGTQRFIARGPKHLRLEIGEKVGLQFDVSKCHFFNGNDGARLDTL